MWCRPLRPRRKVPEESRERRVVLLPRNVEIGQEAQESLVVAPVGA
jgi:hypothetical protein